MVKKRMVLNAADALTAVTAERDWARQMLADAPHDWRCSSEQTGWDRCDCWKAQLTTEK